MGLDLEPWATGFLLVSLLMIDGLLLHSGILHDTLEPATRAIMGLLFALAGT